MDHLADRVIAAMAEAQAVWEGYVSPLTERIDVIRNTIVANAEAHRSADVGPDIGVPRNTRQAGILPA